MEIIKKEINNELYINLSKKNPYCLIGLEKYKKRINNNTLYYFLPSFLSIQNKDSWVACFRLSHYLLDGITKQVYYDLVHLGINNISNRPTCKYCKSEALFDLSKGGYLSYCKDHRYLHISNINSKHFKGVPLSPEHREKLSLAKKGKKLTEEQRLKRPRGYHFNLSPEAKLKISLSKKGKVKSRSYYKSGIYETNKCDEPINYLSSYELDFLKICDCCKYINKIIIPDPIMYKLDGKVHHYYPDFLLKLNDNIELLVEVKAYNMINNREVIYKRLYAKKYCFDNHIKYITVTERDIYLDKNKTKINYLLDFYRFLY